MKNIWKIILVVMLNLLMFTGCSFDFVDGITNTDKEDSLDSTDLYKDKPEYAAKAYYDFYVKQDSSGMIDRGMTEENINAAINQTKEACKEKFIDSFNKEGILYDEKQIEDVINVLLEANKKLSSDVEVISSDKDTGFVKIKSTYFDFNSMIIKVQNETINEFKKKVHSAEEIKAKFATVYLKHIKDEALLINPSIDKKEQTFKFIKKKIYVDDKEKEVWVPDNLITFEDAIDSLIIK